MPDNCKNKRFLGLWGLLALVLTCNNTGGTSGRSSVIGLQIGNNRFMKDETEGQFLAISYNIVGLPAIICSAKTPRADQRHSYWQKTASF